MVDPADETPAIEAVADQTEGQTPRRRRWLRLFGVVALVFAVLLVGLWTQRKPLADRIIAGQLKKLEIDATYKIQKIGTRRQVLSDVVVGDPRHPDFTAKLIEVRIEPRFGIPTIDAATMVEPRLYGTYKGGKLSFGALDKVLFTGGKEPFRLPDLKIGIVDGRARMDTDWGVIGIKLDGGGALRSGFAGTIAAVAPKLAVGGCGIGRGTLFGRLQVKAERPGFVGPLRMAALRCPQLGLSLDNASLALEGVADKALDGLEGTTRFTTGRFAFGTNASQRTSGSSTFTFRQGDVTADYDLTGNGVRMADIAVGRLALEGVLRTRDRFARIESEGSLEGNELRLGSGLDRALAGGLGAAKGTLAEPMLAQIRTALLREQRGSALAALYTLRQTGSVTNLIIPRGGVRGGSGAPLLTLSRFEAVSTPGAAHRLAGNIMTGGAGLPRIEGRLERQPGGGILGRLRMAEYRAGTERLALPQLVIAQNRDGSLGFSGTALLSGKLPGGMARNLVLPLDGIWSPRGGLAAGRRCLDLRYDELGYANLVLTNKRLLVCPGPGGAILRVDGGGVKLAAGAASLNVSGRLGTTPIRIASGPVGFAMPGTLAARSLRVSLGPAANATDFSISNLTARVGSEIAGRFADTDARIGAVPLDILKANGNWRYANGVLSLSNGAFRLEDREIDDRFKPLIARDATLTLANSQIVAQALLREPGSDRAVSAVDIRHNLTNGVGHADLAVNGLTFDRDLQPDTLTRLALGVVANARGTVNGTGRIDWNSGGVRSTGRFSTDNLDFAAAFGPVQGASGTIVFTDLLGMVTAPDQKLHVATINPGIEVNDGILTYQLEANNVLVVKGATWPFMDGTLTLQPTRMVLGAADERRFTLDIDGLNSARFIERLKFGNISATGIFDGTLPLVFDENGGRIVGGKLVSRPGGGNVSYVGELTYRDLSAMGNFAFEALRSIDYRMMSIGMDGDLDGEIATSVRFDGASQGQGAKRNFITRRFEGLPIQVNVNVKAPFIQLITSLRSLYDESYLADPRELGLIGPDGKPLAPIVTPPPAEVPPRNDIQPPESRNRR